MCHHTFVHVVTVLGTTSRDVKQHVSDAVALTSMMFCYTCLNKVLIGWALMGKPASGLPDSDPYTCILGEQCKV